MLTWASEEEIPIHGSWTVPSPLQEGAEDDSSRGHPKALIRGLASRQEAGIHVAGLELYPSVRERPQDLEKASQPDRETHPFVPSEPSSTV